MNEMTNPKTRDNCSNVCLPNCEETSYKASVSQAPFRRCDFKTLGINPLCDLSMTTDNETSFGMIYPQMWGQSVIEQYKYVPCIVTSFVLTINY